MQQAACISGAGRDELELINCLPGIFTNDVRSESIREGSRGDPDGNKTSQKGVRAMVKR